MRRLAAILLALAAGCAHPAPAPPPDSPASGLLDLDSHSASLWSDPDAKATVVLFTRTDCPISNRYAPEIRRLHNTFHPQHVNFFLIYVDPDESVDAIRTHLADYSYPCPGLRDPQHALVAQCGATVTPEAAVFNAKHEMTYRGCISNLYTDLGQARPAATTQDLASAIEATLANRPVATPRTRAIGCTIADLRH